MPVRTSHNRAYLERPRLDEAGTVPTDADRRRQNHGADGRFAPGNAAAFGRGAKGAIERPEEGILKALGGAVTDAEVAALVRDVRTLYTATKRELGCHSPIVLASCATFARETVAAGALSSAAVRVGLTSELGQRFLELSQKASQRSERASLHAVTMAAKLAKPKATTDDVPWLDATPNKGAK